MALTASVPIGCLVAAILHANNIRDLDDDRALGKQTLATIVGPRWAKVELAALLGGAYAALAAGVVLARLLPKPALLAFLSLPTALQIGATWREGKTPLEVAPSVRQAARLHAQFGLLLAIGLLIAACWTPGAAMSEPSHNRDALRAFLREHHTLVVATEAAGQPWCTRVFFAEMYERGELPTAARHDQDALAQADEPEDQSTGGSVRRTGFPTAWLEARGTAWEISDPAGGGARTRADARRSRRKPRRS